MRRANKDEVARPRAATHQTGRSDRRTFLVGAAVGATAAWVTPSILSIDAAAAATKVVPSFVTSATAYSQSATIFDYSRSITLTTSGVAAGDLWMAVLAYDVRGTINGLPGSPAQVWGPIDADSGTFSIYSTRAYMIARILTAANITGGAFSATFSTPSQSILYGGLRGAAVVYRTPSGLGLPAVQSQAGFGPVGGADVVTSTFPAAASSPTTPNRIVRLGAARGYGGLNALSSAIAWLSGPGTGRVSYNSGNFGDRALWISDEANGSGPVATGTWYRQVAANTQNWVTFTASVVS